MTNIFNQIHEWARVLIFRRGTNWKWEQWSLYEDPTALGLAEPEKYYYRVRSIWKCLLVLAFCVAAFTGLVHGIIANDRAQCREKADQMELEWDHGLRSGCQVYIQDVGWRPLDKVRVNYDGSGS